MVVNDGDSPWHNPLKKNTLDKSKFSKEWGNEMLYCYIDAWLIKKKLPSFPTRASQDLKGLFSFFLKTHLPMVVVDAILAVVSQRTCFFIPHRLAPHMFFVHYCWVGYTKTPKETNPQQKTNPQPTQHPWHPCTVWFIPLHLIINLCQM